MAMQFMPPTMPAMDPSLLEHLVEEILPCSTPESETESQQLSRRTGRARKRVERQSSSDEEEETGSSEREPVEAKRQKRMRRNRESAAKSRERKNAYLEELERKVAQLSSTVAVLQGENEELRARCGAPTALDAHDVDDIVPAAAPAPDASFLDVNKFDRSLATFLLEPGAAALAGCGMGALWDDAILTPRLFRAG